jgi:ribosomal protein L37E
MEFNHQEMQTFEKCPRCGSLSCVTELSTSDRKTKCSSCGFEGNVLAFREHHNIELPVDNKRPPDMFGRKQIQDPEEASRRLELLKRLDIHC